MTTALETIIKQTILDELLIQYMDEDLSLSHLALKSDGSVAIIEHVHRSFIALDGNVEINLLAQAVTNTLIKELKNGTNRIYGLSV